MQTVFLTQLTPSEIKELFREEIHAYFSANPTNAESSNQQSKVVDLTGLLKARPFIGSRSTIYKKVSKGLIPHSKEGKKLYFDLNEIDKHLMSNKTKTLSQINQEAQDYLKKGRR